MNAYADNSWYSKNIANGTQSVIIHEQTGRTIAVVYDPIHSPIIAAAPALYEALKRLHEHTRTVDAAYRNGLNDTDPLYRAVEEALRLAEGRG